MIDLRDGIDSLTNFKRQTSTIVDRLQKSGDPLVLTVNGKAQVVVQDAAAYQRMREWAAKGEREAVVAAIKEGLEDAEAGRLRPAKQVLKELAQKYGFGDPSETSP